MTRTENKRLDLRQLMRLQFVRNLMTVSGGGAIAQLIALVSAPFIARLYTPEAFGVQALFMNAGSVLATVAAFSYPVAIVLAKDHAEAVRILLLSLIIAVILSMATTIALLFVGEPLLKLIAAPDLAPVTYLLPAFMLLTTWNTAASQFCMRLNNFRLTAQSNIVAAAASATMKIGVGLVAAGGTALCVISTAALFLRGLLLTAGVKWRTTSNPLLLRPALGGELASVALRYSDFAVLRTPQTLLNAVSRSITVFMFTALFSTEAAGHYALAFTLLTVPVDLVATSISQVLYPRIVQASRHGENSKRLILRVTAALAVLGFFPTLLVVAAGPQLFTIFLGEQWQQAGTFASWMALALYFQLLTRPIVAAVPVFKLQMTLLVYEVVATIGKIAAILIAYNGFGSALSAIMAHSIVSCAFYAGLFAWVLTAARLSPADSSPH